jgi:hypothetical protein
VASIDGQSPQTGSAKTTQQPNTNHSAFFIFLSSKFIVKHTHKEQRMGLNTYSISIYPQKFNEITLSRRRFGVGIGIY